MISRDQLIGLPAGRQLDALVTEAVLGVELTRKDGVPMLWTLDGVVPMFSTHMTDAWKILEHMNVRGYTLDIFISHAFTVTVKKREGGKKIVTRRSSVDEAPHAICIASLVALLCPHEETRNNVDAREAAASHAVG